MKNNQTTKTILIVDDHDELRKSINNWLKEIFPQTVIFEATTGEEAIVLAKKHRPTIVIIDVDLPGINGFDATRLIKKNMESTIVIIVTIHEHKFCEQNAIAAGAAIYCPKRLMYEKLPEAIRTNLVIEESRGENE